MFVAGVLRYEWGRARPRPEVFAVAATPDAVGRRLIAAGLALGAGALGLGTTLLARSRRAAKVNAELWSQATREVADRDLTPPSTVAVDSTRRPRG